MIRQRAIATFRADRATWLNAAREYRAAGSFELYIFAIEGARIAQANLLHVMRKVPA